MARFLKSMAAPMRWPLEGVGLLGNNNRSGPPRGLDDVGDRETIIISIRYLWKFLQAALFESIFFALVFASENQTAKDA